MNAQRNDTSFKTILAIGCVVGSLIGLFLGFAYPMPLANTFSAGSIISFVAFLLSLGAVKDRGNNLPALLAFIVSFLAMSISIFCSGMAV